MYLDNFKIKTKRIIIYIVCVLIPMVVTDSFFVYTVTQNVSQQEQDTMKEVLGKVTNELNTKINNVTQRRHKNGWSCQFSSSEALPLQMPGKTRMIQLIGG